MLALLCLFNWSPLAFFELLSAFSSSLFSRLIWFQPSEYVACQPSHCLLSSIYHFLDGIMPSFIVSDQFLRHTGTAEDLLIGGGLCAYLIRSLCNFFRNRLFLRSINATTKRIAPPPPIKGTPRCLTQLCYEQHIEKIRESLASSWEQQVPKWTYCIPYMATI